MLPFGWTLHMPMCPISFWLSWQQHRGKGKGKDQRWKLLIGSSWSQSGRLLITHRNKDKSSSLTSLAKLESLEAQVLIELIYVRILHRVNI